MFWADDVHVQTLRSYNVKQLPVTKARIKAANAEWTTRLRNGPIGTIKRRMTKIVKAKTATKRRLSPEEVRRIVRSRKRTKGKVIRYVEPSDWTPPNGWQVRVPVRSLGKIKVSGGLPSLGKKR